MINFRLVAHTIALGVLVLLADISLALALLVKPFNEKWAWSWASNTAEWFWSYMQYHWETTLNAQEGIIITGDAIPRGESAIVIANHLSYGDYYLVQSLAVRAGMLGKNRYFVKKEIVYQIPLFGWAFWALGMILVSRNWTNDSRRIEEAFGHIKRNKHDVWVVLYPEGTRRTPKKLLEAQAYERQHGKTETKRVLFPRTKGFASTITGLRDSHVKYLYDLTLLYTSPGKDVERVPSLSDQLSCANLAEAGYRYHIHVNRIPIADLPDDEAGLRSWCENAWVEKDVRLGEILSQYTDERGAEGEK